MTEDEVYKAIDRAIERLQEQFNQKHRCLEREVDELKADIRNIERGGYRP